LAERLRFIVLISSRARVRHGVWLGLNVVRGLDGQGGGCDGGWII